VVQPRQDSVGGRRRGAPTSGAGRGGRDDDEILRKRKEKKTKMKLKKQETKAKATAVTHPDDRQRGEGEEEEEEVEEEGSRWQEDQHDEEENLLDLSGSIRDSSLPGAPTRPAGDPRTPHPPDRRRFLPADLVDEEEPASGPHRHSSPDELGPRAGGGSAKKRTTRRDPIRTPERRPLG
jgi:hypothetical protein